MACSETNTSKPKDVYKYWSGANPPKDMELLQGKYWQSAHWTHEYIMYLKIIPRKEWWTTFINQNELRVVKENWIKPSDCPEWFNPPKSALMYAGDAEFDQGTRCFLDEESGICYLYVIQL